jgi:hypothetical protein
MDRPVYNVKPPIFASTVLQEQLIEFKNGDTLEKSKIPRDICTSYQHLALTSPVSWGVPLLSQFVFHTRPFFSIFFKKDPNRSTLLHLYNKQGGRCKEETGCIAKNQYRKIKTNIPKKVIARHSPNFHIHVSVRDLYFFHNRFVVWFRKYVIVDRSLRNI